MNLALWSLALAGIFTLNSATAAPVVGFNGPITCTWKQSGERLELVPFASVQDGAALRAFEGSNFQAELGRDSRGNADALEDFYVSYSHRTPVFARGVARGKELVTEFRLSHYEPRVLREIREFPTQKERYFRLLESSHVRPREAVAGEDSGYEWFNDRFFDERDLRFSAGEMLRRGSQTVRVTLVAPNLALVHDEVTCSSQRFLVQD